jgi:hypothetical protein
MTVALVTCPNGHPTLDTSIFVAASPAKPTDDGYAGVAALRQEGGHSVRAGPELPRGWPETRG